MLSLLMLLLAIMTAATVTGGNKQSAQTTVSSYMNLLGNIQGQSVRFCRCSHAGEKSFTLEAGPTWQVWGHASPSKFLNLLSRKCYF